LPREEHQKEMDGLEERILELGEQKKSAVAAENYVKAAELKTEIENITIRIRTISASMMGDEETPPK
jgi:DNA-binding ferritin-like protein